MKVHRLPLQRYDEFCELCSEHHEYINCPTCGGEILQFYMGKIARCEEGHVFAIWGSKEKKVELVECEYIWKARFAKVKCGHLEVKQVVGLGYDCCCEEGCPYNEAMSS